MSSPEKQALAFFIERGEYAEGLADTHLRDRENDKARKLYQEAFSFYMKAYKNSPSADQKQEMKEKLLCVKDKGENC